MLPLHRCGPAADIAKCLLHLAAKVHWIAAFYLQLFKVLAETADVFAAVVPSYSQFYSPIAIGNSSQKQCKILSIDQFLFNSILKILS